MIEVRSGKNVAVLYESISEVGTGECSREYNNGRVRDSMSGLTGTGKDEAERWLGAPSIDEFEHRLKFGWGEGADRLRDLATKEIDPVSLRRRRYRTDQGDELDIQAVYRGDLSRAWTRTRRETRTGSRSISIICNLSCSWIEDAKNLFWRGASALKLVEALSQAGYSVAVYGATGTENFCDSGECNLAQFVEIKREDEPLDVSSLAALVAMPGFKRTRFHAGITFAADRIGKDVEEGLGSTCPENIGKMIPLIPIPQNAIIQPEVNSKEQAEEWIDAALAQAQGEIALAA